MAVASVEGLEGLTIGRLADDLGLSKSGLLGHFGSKQGLQLAVVEAAAEVFRREVVAPASGNAPGLPRLRAQCEAWISYLERAAFPGGCLLTAAAVEFDDRDGPVREAVLAQQDAWLAELRSQGERAARSGDLPAGADPEQLAFDLLGVMLALNQRLRLHRDPEAPRRARRAVDRLLGAREPA